MLNDRVYTYKSRGETDKCGIDKKLMKRLCLQKNQKEAQDHSIENSGVWSIGWCCPRKGSEHERKNGREADPMGRPNEKNKEVSRSRGKKKKKCKGFILDSKKRESK